MGFTDSVVPHLDMSKAFSRFGVGPVDAGVIIVVEWSGRGHEGGLKVEIVKDVRDMKEGFDTLVGGINFGFSRGAGRDGLAFGLPMDGAI